jgi:O-acetylhomoserine (thiol)-lyase
MTDALLAHTVQLSPRRHSTEASTSEEVIVEQLRHFGISPLSKHGEALSALVGNVCAANVAAHDLWALTSATLGALDRSDRIAWFNAKRFACFQLAKVLSGPPTNRS